MATPQKEPLRVVTPEELAALERLARSSRARVDRVRRATAVLAVVQGQGFAAAARQAGCASSTTVAKLVARFNRRGLARVNRTISEPRTGSARRSGIEKEIW